MGKQLRTFGLAISMAGLVALPAYAGTTTVNHVVAATPLTVALEVLGSARTVGIVPVAGTDGIRYASSQGVSITNLIEVTFVGATFKAATAYNLCDGATIIANATPGAVATFNFQAIADPNGNGLNPVNLTNAACAAADQPVDVTLTATSLASTATVKHRLLTSGGILIDDSSPANLAAIASKYAITIGNSNHTIDVAVAVGADGTKFTTATGASAAGLLGGAPTVLADSGQGTGLAAPSLRIAVTAKNVDEATNTNGNAAPGLTTGANVIVTGDFTGGVSKTFISDGGTNCDSTAVAPVAGNRVQSTSTTSPITLLIPAAQFSQATAAGNDDFRLCVLVNGTTFLNPRTLQASIDVNILTGAGGNDPAASTVANAQTWTINGADIRVTGVKGGPTGNETVISINNLGVTDGTIRRLEVYRLDGTTTLGAPSCVITNVPAGTGSGQKSIFANSGNTVRATTDITTLCSAQAPFITGASAEAYGARLVLDIAPGSVGVNSVRIFSDGRLLSLPVLKGGPGAAFATE